MIIRKKEIHPFDFEGLQIYDYTAKNPSSSSLAIIEVLSGARHKLAKSNYSDKYYYVIEGRLCFLIDGVEHILEAGDCCLVSRGVAFSYANLENELVKLVLVHTPAFRLEAEEFLE